jgi:hypothetical protein
VSRRGAHRLRRGRPADPARSGIHLLLHAVALGATLAAAVVLVHAGGTWARFSAQDTSASVRVVGWSSHQRELAQTAVSTGPTRTAVSTSTTSTTSIQPTSATSSTGAPTLTPSSAGLVRTGG